jgi:hypothetical protein
VSDAVEVPVLVVFYIIRWDHALDCWAGNFTSWCEDDEIRQKNDRRRKRGSIQGKSVKRHW